MIDKIGATKLQMDLCNPEGLMAISMDDETVGVIHKILLLNDLQRLVVEEVLDHVMQNKGRPCVEKDE